MEKVKYDFIDYRENRDITIKAKRNIDKIRKDFGLPPIKEQNRKCLRCDRMFFSTHIANCICSLCITSAEYK